MSTILFGQVVDEVLDAIRGRQNKDARERVSMLINREYFNLHRRYSWEDAREEAVTIDFTDSIYDDGMWLPSNLAGIDMVLDVDNDIEFIPRNEAESNIDERAYRFYTRRGSKSPLYSGYDGSVSSGSKSFSSADMGTEIDAGTLLTATGEFLRIGNNLGYYKITDGSNPFTLETVYKYEDASSVKFQLRPPETQKLVIVGEEEDKLVDRSVKVYYWTYPEPLVNDDDVVMLPTSDCISLSVISKLPEAKPHRPISQTQVDNAIDDAIRLNADFPRPQSLRGVNGKKISWSSDYYSDRGSSSIKSKTIRW